MVELTGRGLVEMKANVIVPRMKNWKGVKLLPKYYCATNDTLAQD